jgi:hypothetical protein
LHAKESHYWATFRTIAGQRLRFDTRIYLNPQTAPSEDDQVLGCIIGKNPGSAAPARRGRDLQAILLDGDKFLPTVLSILRKSYDAASQQAPQNAYIQVLNLFYLCDRDLANAKRALTATRKLRLCECEELSYPWAWFAWGGPDPALDPLKARFQSLRAEQNFFFDGRAQQVTPRPPHVQELAKHTQGLPQKRLVQFLAETMI